MPRLRVLCVAALTLALLPTGAHAGKLPKPSFTQILQAAGGFTLPPEWAGIWQYEDTTYSVCGVPEFTTESGTDTLCAGLSLDPDDVGIQFDCTGTVTATAIDVVCTGSMELFPGCTLNFTVTTTATRNGDNATYVNQFETTYVPTGCAFQSDGCEVTRGTLTRTGPEPKSCATPTREGTWGTLKLRYR